VRHITPRLCAQFSCISLFLIFNSASIAQIRPGPATRPNVPNPEWALLNVRKDWLHPEVSLEQEARILLATLKDDFRKLQIVNNDLMQRTLIELQKNPEAISIKEIRASLGEMQKRADRLRSNLRLPEVRIPKAENMQEMASVPSLTKGLLMLDQTVMKFVENPIFQQPGILDAQKSTSAAEDLCKILRLTEALRRMANEDAVVSELARAPSK
jgi:hypothetical protein